MNRQELIGTALHLLRLMPWEWSLDYTWDEVVQATEQLSNAELEKFITEFE